MNQHDENPYVGPRAFKKDEADKFYGRDREAQSLLSLVTYERLVLFYAQSGGGKSSLINTQLVPGLEAKGFEVLPVGRVGGTAPPGVEVDNIFVYNLLHSLEQDAEGATASLTPHITLKDFLQQYDLEDTAIEDEEDFEVDDYEVQPRALIIDQFEEILTTNPQHWEKREDFFEQLREAMEDDEYLWVILSMREDYVSRLDPYAHLLPGRLKARFYMERLDFDGALQAVKGPVENLRPFAEGVAEELVDNLCLIQDESGAGFVKGQDVQPVQLQVVCYQLWENLKDHPGSAITADDLNRLTGGEDLAHFVDGALQQFYEQALAKITEDVAGQFELRDWFESKLITKAQTRALVHQLSDTTGGLDNAVVKKLEDAYLLRAESRSSGQWYELTHDRMIPPILQANAEWQANHPLIQAALAWKNAGRPEAMLYLGQRLAAACEDPDAEINLVQEFLEAGREAERKRELTIRAEEEKKRADEQAKAAKRLRFFTVALLAALLFAIGAVIWAVDSRIKMETAKVEAENAATEAETARKAEEVQRIEAETQREKAEEQRIKAEKMAIDARNQAEASKLLVQAEINADAVYTRALLLSLEALRFDEVPQAYDVLLTGIARAHHIALAAQEYRTDQALNRVAISRDGQTLAVGGFDGVVTLWEIRGGQLSATPTQRLTVDQPVYGLALSPDGRTLATATGNRDAPEEEQYAILFWDITADGPISDTLADQLGSVWRLDFSPKGQRLASGHYDGTVSLWDLSAADSSPITLSSHSDWVWDVAFSPDGQMLATSGKDGNIALWDFSTSTPTKQILQGHEMWVNDVAFSPDGQRLASASDDGTVRLWDVATGEESTGSPLTEHTDQVWTVAFSPDGQMLASGSRDNSIIVWRVKTRRPIRRPFSQHSGVEDIVFSSDGTGLVSVGDDKVALWDVASLISVVPLRLGRSPIPSSGGALRWETMLSSDGRIAASLGEDDLITIWNPITGEQAGQLFPDIEVSSLALSADGQTLAVAGRSGNIEAVSLWDVKDQPQKEFSTEYPESINRLALSQDGKQLAVAGDNARLTFWNLASDPISQTLTGHRGHIQNVVFSPDGSALASAAQDGTIILWDLSAAPPSRRILKEHTREITDLAFSPDGKALISAGEDHRVVFWDAKTAGVLLREPLRYTDVVQDIAFSSDGQTLALADSTGTLTLWDIAADEVSGDEVVGSFSIGYEGIQDLAFSKDTLLAADTGAVTRWAVDPSKWKKTACALAGRNLTWSEWNGAFSGDAEVYTKTCAAYPIHPTVVEAKIAEGERYVRQLEIAEARAAFEEANELFEGTALVVEERVINTLLDAVRERFLFDDFVTAREYLQAIHDCDPTLITNVETAIEAGQALEQGRSAIAKAEYDEALSALNRAGELDPQFVVNQKSDLAMLYYKVCRGILDTSASQALPPCERAVALAGETEDLMLNFEICRGSEVEALTEVVSPSCRHVISLADEISLGEKVEGEVEAGSGGVWTFAGQAEQRIRIMMNQASGEFDPYLVLLNSDGKAMITDDDSGSERNAEIAHVLPQDGDYIIFGSSHNSRDGVYTLSLTEIEEIALGKSVTRDLEENSLWTFEGQAGQMLKITMDAVSLGLDPYLRLLGPDESVIAEDDDGGEGYNARIDGLILSQDGTYTIQTEDRGGAFGRYTLSLVEVSPEPIAYGEPVTRDLEENSFWTFEGQAGQMLKITMDAVSDDLDPYLHVVGPDGDVIAEDDDGGEGHNACIDGLILSQAGTYTIQTQDLGGAFGRYTLSLEGWSPERITLGESVTRDLEESIAWTFEGQAGQILRITMDAVSPDLDPYLRLVGPDRDVIAEDDNGGGGYNARMDVILSQNGTYIIQTEGFDGAFGRYALSLAEVSPEPIAYGESVTQDLEENSFWTFEGQAGQMLRITMDAVSPDLDPYLRLLEPDGDVVDEDDDGGEEFNACMDGLILSQDGTYIVQTQDVGGDLGRYTLSLAEVSPEPIAYGEPVTRSLEENSFWAFEGQAGQMLRITMDAVSDDLDPYLRLVGPDRNVIAEDDDSGGGYNARIDDLILLQEGTYIIHTQGLDGPSGRYTLLLDEVPAETIAFGESVDGDFEDGIAWTFEGQVGQIISVELRKTFSGQEAELAMILPNGTKSINRDGEAETVTADLVAPTTGIYRIFPQGEGAYILSLAEVTATGSMRYGDTISSTVMDASGDHWTFYGEDGDAVKLTMSSGAFEPYIELYGPDGMLQQRDTGSGPDGHASLHFMPGVGTYIIVARSIQEGTGGPYTLTLTRTDTLPVPQMCGMDDDNVDYGPITEGARVILGRHRAVNGETNWSEMMDQYVGEQAQVTALPGADSQGSPGVRVDVDDGDWFWRIRDLRMISP